VQALTDLGLAGNCLTALPESIGHLTALEKLACNGNSLQHLPASLTGLTALKQLWLQRNSLTSISPVSKMLVCTGCTT
jgi:internalin A